MADTSRRGAAVITGASGGSGAELAVGTRFIPRRMAARLADGAGERGLTRPRHSPGPTVATRVAPFTGGDTSGGSGWRTG